MLFKLLFGLSRKIPGINCLCRFLYDCDIPRKTKIGEGLHLIHNGRGVIINPHTVIGNHVKIQHHVTIGENAVMGAGTLVTHDVPPNTVMYNKREDHYHEKKAGR